MRSLNRNVLISIVLSVLVTLSLFASTFNGSVRPAYAANNYVVSSLNDIGSGSLRDAITQVNGGAGGDTITFSVTGTILLNSTLPDLSKNVTITGPGASLLTINGSNANRLVWIAGNVIVNLSGLTITHFTTNLNISAIANDGILSVRDVVFSNNISKNVNGGVQPFTIQVR